MELTKSKRIVRALLQLEQFSDFTSEGVQSAIHMLTGVVVSPHMQDDDDEGVLVLKFSGGVQAEVIGDKYLRLQIAESAAHEIHLDETNKSPIAIRSNQLFEHFERKYDL